MSLNVPVGYKYPDSIITIEAQIIHDILVASNIYRGQKVIEEDGIARAVADFYFFYEGSSGNQSQLRIGFRGSFGIDPEWSLANEQNKSIWEYVREHAIISLPVAYYEEL